MRGVRSRVPGQNHPEPLPSLYSEFQPIPKRKSRPLSPEKRIGFAVVGLGIFALDYILPALSQCSFAKLAAVMTSDPEGKGIRVAKEYGLREDSVYGYEEWDRLKLNKDVQVVYIVTPNHLHKKQVVEAARIGKHILCEKAMALNSIQALEMIEACELAGVKFMMGYRLHFEPHHLFLKDIIREGQLGVIKMIEAHHGQIQDHNNQWRHSMTYAGGGSLWGIGIYCLNFARFVTGQDPIDVSGHMWSPSNDDRFKEVEANVVWQMRFPSGVIAKLSSSYDSYSSAPARIYFEKGVVDIDPAFSYWGIKMQVRHVNPHDTEHSIIKQYHLGQVNQFAAEMDHMAECILTDANPRTNGIDGLKDILIMEAIYRSAKENRSITLNYEREKQLMQKSF